MYCSIQKRLLLISIVSAGFASLFCSCSLIFKPLYQPGYIQQGINTPPAQKGTDNDKWKVESNIELYHFSEGSGREVLVIHGGPGIPFSNTWKGLSLLRDSLEANYYHQRGCGKSSIPVDSFSSKNFYKNMKELDGLLGLGAQITDIERIRIITKQNRLTLIGHSYGGFLAALYAVEFPERVEALVLVAPAGILKMPSEQDDLFTITRERLPENRKPGFDDWKERYFAYGKLFTRTEQELAELNSEFGTYFLEVLDVENSSEMSSVKSAGWMVHAQYLSMGKKHDYRGELKNISASTLVLHGENDILPAEVSREYAELIPNARLTIIKNATHFPFDENPEDFSAEIISFLSGLND
ncbi:MAG: alpha/beta hydrolase [Candidatus Electryonea clarkiae]|nr:alpha/beta hydrolase [Candidatus Electryonea clarkiae]MDP8287569.1 alpha/beta hydrolase [Candidatus Electryonea clarkiae]